ncbi:MAG: aminotransferase class I/II-fold pyridoxal phosphate-dependent enzyme, partial [Ghiorsea sp.]
MPARLPHGGNIEAHAKRWGCATDDILDLSTGLHPAGEPKWLGKWLHAHANLVAHYPDSQGEPARSSLASFMGVPAENILMLAGAQAAIEVLPQAMGWKTMTIRLPCYSEPLRAAKRAHCTVIPCDMDSPPPLHTEALWLTSPHNPCGRIEIFPADQHGVFDESYMPFAERQRLGVMPNVLRLGSLTKTFCIP